MKQLFTFVLLISITTFSALAQIKPSAFAIGGSGYYNVSDVANNQFLDATNTAINLGYNSKAGKFTSYEALPQISLNLSDNLAVGVAFGISSAKLETINSGVKLTYSQTVTSFNPFARYYFMYNDNGGFFCQGTLSLGTGSLKQPSFSSLNSSSSRSGTLTTFGVNFQPGLIYFISDTWSIQGTYGRFGYNRINESLDADGTSKAQEEILENYGFGFDLTTFNLGVQYWIGRK